VCVCVSVCVYVCVCVCVYVCLLCALIYDTVTSKHAVNRVPVFTCACAVACGVPFVSACMWYGVTCGVL